MFQYLSQSMINSWMMCPERFRRRYCEDEIIPPGIAARIGTGFHKGAELNHKAKLVTGKDEPLDVIQDAARDGYVQAVQEGVFFSPEEAPSAQLQLTQGVDTVVSLAECYYQELAPQIYPAKVEAVLYMDIPTVDLPLRGTIDVLTTDHWLPDLKTASRKWSQSKADTSVQATLYRELVRTETGTPPKKISFEVFVKNSKGPEHQSVETMREDDDFLALSQRIAVMMSMIQAGAFPPAAADAWMCQPKWCGYFWTCPYIAAHRKCHN
jgi:hypothetical protein